MTWRASSYSASSGNCVQVRGDLAALRDSKDRTGPELRTAEVRALLHTVKDGLFDR